MNRWLHHTSLPVRDDLLDNHGHRTALSDRAILNQDQETVTFQHGDMAREP